MYIGTYYNSYYNSVFGNTGSSLYGRAGKVGQNMFFPSSSNIYNQSAFGSDALKYVQNIKTASAGLGGALKSLSGGGLFARQSAVSADTGSVELKDSGTASRTGAMASGVSVERMATAQVNEGAALSSKASAGIQGYQQFAVEIGGSVHQISFEALESDTNGDIQAKMAQAINERGIGITAKVQAENGASKLVLEAGKTGFTAGSFEIRDVAGGSAQAMGVGDVSRGAQDAAYRLNGGELKYSASNTVDIGGGVTATFKKPTDGTVSITRGIDASLAIDKAEQMAKSYNALYSESLKNTSDPKANNLFIKLIGISRTYAGTLADAGISFDSDGFMTVDAEKMQAAAQNGKLQTLFTENAGKSYGFANQLARAADDVQRNTNRYVSQSSFLQNSGVSDLPTSGGTSSLLSALFGSTGSTGTGWMFDFLL